MSFRGRSRTSEQITIYTYGVLLAAAYLLGLKLAMIRAQARGLDGARVLDLGIYIIISALIGAKLLLVVTEFRTFRADPSELLTLARSGGVFYGGLIMAVAVALWYIRRAGTAVVDDVRRVRSGYRARSRHRPVRVSVRGLLLRQADQRALGNHVHRSLRRRQRRNAAWRCAAPDTAVRGGRRVPDPDAAARHRAEGPAISRANVLGLHPALRDLAVRHRVLSRRPAGTVGAFSTSQFISIILVPLSIVMLVYLARAKTPAPKAARKRVA